jgi:hypothetical protein
VTVVTGMDPKLIGLLQNIADVETVLPGLCWEIPDDSVSPLWTDQRSPICAEAEYGTPLDRHPARPSKSQGPPHRDERDGKKCHWMEERDTATAMCTVSIKSERPPTPHRVAGITRREMPTGMVLKSTKC